ncbi:ABC transporter substrate-binding protein [Limibaculum sp. M0105]|uniref:ABC transporter substrate-binding protein n=1 Tax=Thermohalobaculum xanthum TaxID=2753746 RepID=A0A8J7SFX1_9RHOB|nr:ABC transporter substrate-binding protein [Thermohalobaculum xanthum]MBK0399807.1 ABC transporter substrate-binding protein [Thermohalobaculum xanthum]
MRRLIALILALGLGAPAAAQEAVATFGSGPEVLRVEGSTDLAVFGPVLEAFASARPGISIVYEQRGTNDLFSRAADACANAAQGADVVISSAIDLQVKLVNDGCAQPHRTAAAELLPGWARWRDELFGLTFEPAVIVYNRALVPAADVPATRFDLIDLLRAKPARYAGKVATYDIEQSGLGYLFAFADSQEATTFGRLMEAFERADAVATCCSAELIDAVAEGRFLIAYNLLGSYALARAAEDARIGVVAPSDYTLALSRAAMVPRHATNPRAAKALIDYLLSPEGRFGLAQASLIVSFGETDDPATATLSGTPSTLRPIALSPALLVGLDRQKRALFTAQWRSIMGSRDALP